MFQFLKSRKSRSASKNRAKNSYHRRPSLEPLERRELLSISNPSFVHEDAVENVFSRFVGVLADDSNVEIINVSIAPEAVSSLTGEATLGFHFKSRNGDGIDPNTVKIVPLSISPWESLVSVNDLGDSTDSVVVGKFTEGDYRIYLDAVIEHRNQYELDVFLVGDADGDRKVTRDDLLAIQSSYGSSVGDDNYNIAADADLNGLIDARDLAFARENWYQTFYMAPPQSQLACGPQEQNAVPKVAISSPQLFTSSYGDTQITTQNAVLPLEFNGTYAQRGAQCFFESTGGWVQDFSPHAEERRGIYSGAEIIAMTESTTSFAGSTLRVAAMSSEPGPAYEGNSAVVEMTWVSSDAGYDNVLYIFECDEYGNIGGGASASLTDVGSKVIGIKYDNYYTFIVEQGDFDHDTPGGGSHWWYMPSSRNPDDYAHFRDGSGQLIVEDLCNGSPCQITNPGDLINDADFNDIVFTHQAYHIDVDVDNNNDTSINDIDDPSSDLYYEVTHSKFIPVGWDTRTPVKLHVDSGFDWSGYTFTVTYPSCIKLFNTSSASLSDPDAGYIASGDQINGSSLTSGLTYYMSGVSIGTGQITLTATESTVGAVSDKVSVAVVLDLDIDSNNDGSTSSNDNYHATNPTEDMVEDDSTKAGKVLAVGMGQRTPIKISKQSGIESQGMTFRIYYDDQELRIYDTATYSVNDPTAGFVASGESLTTLPETLYVDGIATGNAYIEIRGQHTNGAITKDEVKVIVALDLDTDSNNDGTISDTDNYKADGTAEDMIEDENGTSNVIGKVLIKEGIPAETKVAFSGVNLSSQDFSGHSVRLIAAAGLNVWADKAKTTRLTACTNPAVFNDDSLGETYVWSGSSTWPSTIYIEGSLCGERDLQWQLLEGSFGGIVAKDTVKFSVHDLTVEWDQYVNPSDSTDTGSEIDGNPSNNGGGRRIYPERTSPSDTGGYNKVNLKFTLTPAAPVDVTIHYKTLDPDNYLDNDQNDGAFGLGAIDNNGQYSNSFGTVIFQANDTIKNETITISDARPGDNFIAIASANSGDLSLISESDLGTTTTDRYEIDLTNAWVAQTDLLTVWRKLWMELDQMVAPTASDFIGTQAVYDATGKMTNNGVWGTQTPTNEPFIFDVCERPAAPDTTNATAQFARACISVTIPTTTQLVSWSGSQSLKTVPFSRYLSGSAVTTYTNTGRDTPRITSLADQRTFWFIHVVSAYESTSAILNEQGVGTLGYAYTDSIVLYDEEVRDMLSTVDDYDAQGTKFPITWINEADVNGVLLLHESGHYFLGGHGSSSGLADQDVMCKTGALPGGTTGMTIEYLRARGSQVFNVEQLVEIQDKDKPTA